jgi:hypothetical protein
MSYHDSIVRKTFSCFYTGYITVSGYQEIYVIHSTDLN